MSKILKVVSSFRGDASVSNQVSDAIVAQLKEKDANATVVERNLFEGGQPPHLDSAVFMAFITPEADRTEAQQAIVAQSDVFVNEVMEADKIVIGVPMYNFTIPSVLKSWLDQLTRTGVTFKYTPEGVSVGLVEGKEVFLAVATGGIYSEGAAANIDFTESYMRAVLQFMGMTNVTVFRAEGMAIPDLAAKAVPAAIEKVEEFAF